MGDTAMQETSMNHTTDDAIFIREGTAVFRATRYAAGPWHRELQHGGAPSALVAWAAEQVETAVPMRVARVTVDLVRPVPVATLYVETEVLRQGRKIQLVQVRVLAAGVEVTRGTVLRVRIVDAPLPAGATMPAIDVAPEDVANMGIHHLVGFGTNFDVRRVHGGFGPLGPGRVWFRQHRALLADEVLSPLTRAMAVADFSNGVGAALSFEEWTYVNADLSVSFARMPEGEWILSDAETWANDDGVGIATARLADRRGYFARAVQSLVLDPR